MQFLLGLIEQTPLGDERLSCLLDCAAESFQHIPEDKKQQFLSAMIPYLINICSTDISVSIKQVVSGPEYQMTDNGMEYATIDTKNMGKVQLSLNTSAIEAVQNAIRLIHNLLLDGKSLLLPYVEQIYNAVKVHTDFSFNEEVRTLTSRIFPILFNIMITAVKENAYDINSCIAFYKEAITTLFQQYDSEESPVDRCEVAGAISDFLRVSLFNHSLTH